MHYLAKNVRMFDDRVEITFIPNGGIRRVLEQGTNVHA